LKNVYACPIAFYRVIFIVADPDAYFRCAARILVVTINRLTRGRSLWQRNRQTESSDEKNAFGTEPLHLNLRTFCLLSQSPVFAVITARPRSASLQILSNLILTTGRTCGGDVTTR
jgi:hypothetical protein